MIKNDTVFLLTTKRKFGENCYQHLKEFKKDIKATLYLDLEKCLPHIQNKEASLVLADKEIMATEFGIKLQKLTDRSNEIIAVPDTVFQNELELNSLNILLKNYFKVDENNISDNRIRKPDIVGIGASTGGPSALLDLFSGLNIGLPYPIIIVNHIPQGDFAASLADSLTYNSKIHVSIIQSGMILQKGRAYLCPGGKHVTVKKTKGKMQYIAYLNDDQPLNSCKPSIDMLFNSLSQLKFTHVGAIILTGMGSDGTQGAKAIYKNLGCVYAQNPDECLITSMPSSVIQSGSCDKKLTINELAYHLNKGLFVFEKSSSKETAALTNNNENKSTPNSTTLPKRVKPKNEISHELLTNFKKVLEQETANTGNSDNAVTLKRKLQSLLLKFNTTSYDELYDLALSKKIVKQAIIDCLTNHETFFFRDKYPYEFIHNVFIPDRIKKKKGARIWSSACSTGQETYSIAMTLINSLNKHKTNAIKSREFKIVASDISRESLQKAKNGTYTDLEISRGLPPQLLKHFLASKGSYKVKPEVHNLVDFRHLNLYTIPKEFPSFDLIFLRYVLIYFSDQKKQQVLDNVINTLKPGGYLILDPAISLNMKSNAVQALRYRSQTIFVKKG